MSRSWKFICSTRNEKVEKMFDTYKTVLNADKLYLQDDESVFGHVFIAFLSLYIHCKLEQLLKKGELNHKFTPIDLLFKYSKVYHLKMRAEFKDCSISIWIFWCLCVLRVLCGEI